MMGYSLRREEFMAMENFIYPVNSSLNIGMGKIKGKEITLDIWDTKMGGIKVDLEI